MSVKSGKAVGLMALLAAFVVTGASGRSSPRVIVAPLSEAQMAWVSGDELQRREPLNRPCNRGIATGVGECSSCGDPQNEDTSLKRKVCCDCSGSPKRGECDPTRGRLACVGEDYWVGQIIGSSDKCGGCNFNATKSEAKCMTIREADGELCGG